LEVLEKTFQEFDLIGILGISGIESSWISRFVGLKDPDLENSMKIGKLWIGFWDWISYDLIK